MCAKRFNHLSGSFNTIAGRVDELEKRLDQIPWPLPSSNGSFNKVAGKMDELEKRLDQISLLLPSNNGPTSETTSQDRIQASSSTDVEEGSPIDRLERLEQTAADITSALASMDIVTDSSQLPAYNDVKPSELVRLRNKIECAKNALLEAMVQKTGSASKPPPPAILASDQDDIFVAWCISQCCDSYKRALVIIIEGLQVQEEKEWKEFGLSKAHAQDSNDSLYRKHLRVKIEAAKRSVTDYHLKRIAGTLKYHRMPDMSPDTSPRNIDVDVLVIGCLRAKEFENFRQRDGSVNNHLEPYDRKIGNLITGLLKKEEDETSRLLQLKASDKGEKR